MKEFYEKEIENNLEEIKQKEEINNKLINDLDNIKKLYDENKTQFDLIQKENISNIEKVNKSLNSERDFESKAKELVNIIKSQDQEIQKLNDIINTLKQELNKTKKNNEDLLKENEELKKKNNEHENVMINMNSAIEDLKIKLKNNNEKLKKQNEKNDNINKNYQNSIIKINELEKEIKTLKNQNNELIKTMEKEQNQISLYPKAIFDVLSYFKTVMNSGYFWASTYIKPHLEYENLEAIIADNGFILEAKELINNIENNFSFLKNKNDSSNVIDIIGEIYQEYIDLIKNLYNEINEEFVKLNKIISNQKSGNNELISKINNIENNSSRLKEEFKKTMSENKINEKSLNDIKNENSIIKLENKNIKNKLQQYEQDIDNIYQKLKDIIKSNLTLLNSNSNNIFQLYNNENDSINKLNTIKINLINFSQLAINSLSEISNQNEMMQDYNKLKEECKKMNKELIQFKKEYSTLLENYNKEKEMMTNLIQEEKEREIKILKKEDFDKINNLNKIINKKEEEIEKLSNDNNLLYQQYILSQNNFEKYKLSRKKDDLNLQEKIAEMKRDIDSKNKEIKKYKNDNEIILNKSKIIQESLIKKNQENETLQKQLNSLKKQKI
jgi:chromosome segregation ATPase